MVIFVFLRNVWATVIPSLALPFSIIGTFAVMYMLGYSLDNLSMMALILSVGFVVDDAIVMLENIYRHVEMGEDPLTASLVGSREIGFTIVSMTLSLAAVFIPVLFMGGVLGRLFREFAVTICVAILISGVVSVTLTPMLCSRFLKKPHAHGEAAAPRSIEVTERCVRQAAARLRPHAADRAAPPAGDDGGVRCVVLALTALLFVDRAERLHPRSGHRPDRGHHRSGAGHVVRQAGRVSGRRSPTSSAQDPNVEGLVSTIGGSAAATLGGPNLGQIVVHLKPRGERKELANEIIDAAAAAARRGSRHARSTCRIRRRSASAGRSARACISTRCSRRIKRALYATAAQAEERRSRTCPASRI